MARKGVLLLGKLPRQTQTFGVSYPFRSCTIRINKMVSGDDCTPDRMTSRSRAKIDRLIGVFFNLGCQKELDVSGFTNGILDHDGDVRCHGDNDVSTQRSRLGKKVEVAQGKSEFDRFLHFDNDPVVFFFRGSVGTNEHVAGANVSRDGEAHAFLGTGNLARVAEYLQIPDDALELRTGHLYGAVVGCFGNSELFAVNLHELELEVSNRLGLGAFEHHGERVAVVFGLHDDHIVRIHHFEDFAHVGTVRVVMESRKSVGARRDRRMGGKV